jgi:hypothetical protein
MCYRDDVVAEAERDEMSVALGISEQILMCHLTAGLIVLYGLDQSGIAAGSCWGAIVAFIHPPCRSHRGLHERHVRAGSLASAVREQ